ncbi:MAG: L,D-transpeptidase family protein [Anaerolineae bacterium]|nr:L,D-transpeptidase family protein [Anaerolineae bacterium]
MRRKFTLFPIVVTLVMALIGHTAPAQATSPNAPHAPVKNTCGSYTVKAGDTVSKLSLRLDLSHVGLVTVNALIDARGKEKPISAGMRLLLPCELPSPRLPAQSHHIGYSAPTAKSSGGAKSIYVSIAKQRAYAYQGDNLVYSFVISTALPQYGTKRGSFRIKTKMPEAYSSRWQLRMPYWMGIYDAGPSENGFHALPINKRGQRLWGGLLGRPASFGCIILSPRDAAVLYDWADMGTPVVIR